MKKRIPTGIVEYAVLRNENYYTVDKTLMIKDFIERGSVATLITRPRRFGKTSNMSMMSEFFDIRKDSSQLFQDTNISKTEYYKEMNQYPVIYLSFANCKGEYMAMKKALFDVLRNEYARYQTMFEEEETTKDSVLQVRKNYKALCNEEDLVSISTSIMVLSKFLYEKLNKRVMIFIDEYDTPFIEAHINGFYNEISGVLSVLLHSAIKDNKFLQYAMLTGIQRVAKENIFSDLNNLAVFTVKDSEYAQYFGFTTEETKAFLEYYGVTLSDNVKAMYNGYHMGDIEIYNPWSIINYAATGKLISFWVNTSSNSMIKKLMKQSDATFNTEYERLVKQGYLETQVSLNTSFYEDNSTSNLWGLFVNAGYLTIQTMISEASEFMRVRIPNQEVAQEFSSLTAAHLSISENAMVAMFHYFRTKDLKAFLEAYKGILLHLPSYHDLTCENSYHMMMLGLCAWLSDEYQVTSNRESGKGRYDILLKAKKKGVSSFILEMKYTKDADQLERLAKEAVEQMEEKQYDCELSDEIILIGLAHCGKDVAMYWKLENK